MTTRLFTYVLIITSTRAHRLKRLHTLVGLFFGPEVLFTKEKNVKTGCKRFNYSKRKLKIQSSFKLVNLFSVHYDPFFGLKIAHCIATISSMLSGVVCWSTVILYSILLVHSKLNAVNWHAKKIILHSYEVSRGQ